MNTQVHGLSTPVAFLVFSVFALASSVVITRLFHGDVFRHLFDACRTWQSWVAALAYAVGFFLGLQVYQGPAEAIIVFLVADLLTGPCNIVGEFFVLQKKPQKPVHSALAFLVILGCLWVEKFGVGPVNRAFMVVDAVLVFAFANVIMGTASEISRAHGRQKVGLSKDGVLVHGNIVAILFALAWIVADVYNVSLLPRLHDVMPPRLPTSGEWVALAYLGIFPTAIGLSIQHTVQDKAGFFVSEAVEGVRPLLVYLFGFLPLSWLVAKDQQWSGEKAAALVLACVAAGAIVIFERPPEK
ncbi:hypothetical protein HYW18_01025 [Candidatus Uhrbacteria bacterium]|nr:hypothetical protein [Candidatus Uhrbacteria bacterium]